MENKLCPWCGKEMNFERHEKTVIKGEAMMIEVWTCLNCNRILGYNLISKIWYQMGPI